MIPITILIICGVYYLLYCFIIDNILQNKHFIKIKESIVERYKKSTDNVEEVKIHKCERITVDHYVDRANQCHDTLESIKTMDTITSEVLKKITLAKVLFEIVFELLDEIDDDELRSSIKKQIVPYL